MEDRIANTSKMALNVGEKIVRPTVADKSHCNYFQWTAMSRINCIWYFFLAKKKKYRKIS